MNGIIEIGTNSLKLLIYKSKPNFEVIYDKTSITRLGQDYHKTGIICHEALERNIAAISKSLEICKTMNCSSVSLYGTMIFRSASNIDYVRKSILDKTSLNLQILTGQEEANYSYLAASYSLAIRDKRLLVIDTGGGSTELILGFNDQVNYARSINIGAVTLTDLFDLANKVTENTLSKCQDYLKSQLQVISLDNKPEGLVGIGGTITTISAMVQKLETYSADKVQGSSFYISHLNELVSQLASKNLQERRSIIGLSPKRADIILGGLLIVRAILLKFASKEMIVCDNGLRYGLALNEWRIK